MEKKRIFLPIILALIIIFSIGSNVSQAVAQYVIGLKAVRSYPGHANTATSDLQADSIAYSYMINQKIMWKLLEYQGATINQNGTVVSGTGTANWNNTIYCLKAGLGFTNSTGGLTATEEENIRILYPYSETMAAQDTRTPISGRTEYKSIIKMGWEAQKNNSILWILDNAYMRNHNNTTKAEMKKYLFSNMLDYIKDTNNSDATVASIRETLENIGTSNIEDIILTDSDIDVIQQAAIWYFTNDGESAYKYSGVPALQISETATTDSNSYNSIETIDEVSGFDGEGYRRSAQAQALFYYLTRAAEKESTNYLTSRALRPTIKLDNETAEIEVSGNKTIVGPFKYTQVKNGKNVYGYEITVEAKKVGENSYTELSNYKLVKANKTTQTTLEEVNGQDFYVVIEDNNISNTKVSIGAKYLETNATIWTAEDPASAAAQTEQPIVIINKTEQPISASKEVESNFKGSYNLVLIKEDAKGEDINSTATFEVNGASKQVTGRLTVVNNKEINSSNVGTVDTYIIKETVPPDEYCPFDGTIKIEVYKKQDGSKYVVDRIKYYVDDVEVTSNRDDLNVYLNTNGNIYVEVVDYQFDLALRKYITKVNGEEVATRVPNIDKSTIASEGTATYKHRKDPVTVKTGDTVTYKITIYNEGEIKGYATKVVDQLPAGLKFKSVVSGNFDADTSSYNQADTNTLTLVRKSTATTPLNAYTSGNLDSETIEIECEVTEVQSTSNKVLTNVAWIAEELNTETNTTIINDQGLDRDSEPGTKPNVNKDNMSNYTGKGNKTDLTDSNNYYKGEQDDDDFEKIVLPKVEFDLALRKYITKVNGEEVATRVPNIDKSTIVTEGTATYKHRKDPVTIKTGDTVTYEITIYNEGQISGKATEVIDQLPTGLKFVRVVSGNYAAEEIDNNKIKFTAKSGLENLKIFDGTTIDSETIEIECLVTAKQSNSSKVLTNVAWISADNNPLDAVDRDSQTTNSPENKNTPDYKGNSNNKTDLTDSNNYYKGEQDDDDFEKIILEPGFDLSLRKFVVSLNGEELTGTKSRIPQVDVSELKNGTSTTAKYTHSKTPISIQKGDVVIYTIRVYNEGNADGYAEEITDYLPEGLGYLVSHKLNAENRWKLPDEVKSIKLKDIQEATNHLELDDFEQEYVTSLEDVDIVVGKVKLTTNKLSYNSVEDSNIIKAYDGGNTLNYKDIQIACVVVSDSLKIEALRNIAEISKAKDKVGNDMNNNEDDRDSVPNNVNIDNYNPPADNSKYQQDDDDYEDLVLKHFDLALRKFITKVNGIAETVSRAPIAIPDSEKLIKYEHTKDPVKVKHNDLVTYTLRIFNEGTIAGYAEEIKDHIPDGLQFVENDETNKKYGWKMYKLVNGKEVETDDETEATIIRTDYLSIAKGKNTNLIKAFDEIKHISTNGSYYLPDYKDVEVVLKVTEPSTSDRVLTNIAQISEDADENGNPVNDVDSTPNNYPDEDKPRREDDIDHDNVVLTYFDLALRKFITEIRTKDVIEKVDSRIPTVNYEDEKISYTHPKDPILVTNGSIVTYTIRIFNEGKMDGYAEEVTDNLPQGLVFLPDNETNKEYRWIMIDEEGNETDDASKAVKITTDYLSKAQESEDGENLIKAFDKTKAISESNPDYRDVKVVFRVTEEKLPQDRILINTAEISEDADENGKPVDDEDSKPDNNKPEEDDIDIEKVRVKYFDLSLLKYVSKVIVTEDGKTKVTQTGYNGLENPEPMPKVEIKYNKLNSTVVKFAYTIKITNEGEIEGYATEITDDIPSGLRFVKEDNPSWTEVDGKIKTRALENTLLQPGESATVEVIFTWNNDKNNLGEKTNTAEISEDKNEYDSPDIDSTPGNEVPGEDDIDIAKVILSIKTGKENIAPILIVTAIILVTIAGGVVLIKKYVI